MQVLFLDQPGANPQWREAIIAAVGERHDLVLVDRSKPIEPQIAEAEVVIDMGSGSALRLLVEAAKKARLWQLVSVGYDHFDVDCVRRKGIAVAHCPGTTSSPALAETAMMLMLMLVKRFHQCQESLRQRCLYRPMGTELRDRILGLLGFGASGQALAHLARAFGMRLMIVEPRPIDPTVLERLQPLFVGKPDAVDRLMSEADFISLHVPLSPETRRMIDARRIGLMKPTACLINVARAGLVDEDALYEALQAGRIAGVGTDVYADTGRTTEDPIFQHPNLVALPHIAGGTDGTVRRRAEVVAENVDRIAQSLEPKHRIDL